MRNIINLRKGEFLHLDQAGGRVVKGLVWLTVPGLSEDFLLEAGAPLPCCTSGVLLEALSDVTIDNNMKLLKKIA